MPGLRIFSYLPNPRLWKATIAARLNGVELEVRGARPGELADWIWDFDARPASEAKGLDLEAVARRARRGFRGRLYKTDAFLEANPFGTVPVAFSPDGRVGVFESNSILRAVARLGEARFPLCGPDPYTSARVDAFLDASLVFARDSQIYLLALASGELDAATRARSQEAFGVYLDGIEAALAPDRSFLVGDAVTLADICFACELALFAQERLQREALAGLDLEPIFHANLESEFPRALGHLARLCEQPAFAPELGPHLERIARA